MNSRKNLRTFFLLLLLALISPSGLYAGNLEIIADSCSIDNPHIIVVTNRPFEVDDLTNDYFPNMATEDQSLTYLEVFKDNDKWKILPLNIETDFNTYSSGFNDWLVYVHGDSQTPELAFMRGLQLQEEYQVNVIVFSWPSKDPILGGLQNFKNSKNLIEKGTPAFAQFVQKLDSWRNSQTSDQCGNLTLFLHSLGNYYLQRLVADSLLAGMDHKIFDNVILNAAAVNQKDHHLWLEKITFQQRIFVNSNSKDMTLKGVSLFTDCGVQLGEKAESDFSSNATYINFNQALDNELNFGLLHGYYVGVIPGKYPHIYKFYHAIFHGQPVEFSSPEMFVQNDTIPVYEIIN